MHDQFKTKNLLKNQYFGHPVATAKHQVDQFVKLRKLGGLINEVATACIKTQYPYTVPRNIVSTYKYIQGIIVLFT